MIYAALWIVFLAWTPLRQGERDEALRLIAEFESMAREEIGNGSENYTIFFSMVACRVMLGDTAGALDWRDRANATAGIILEWAMANDPLLEPLRATPRFRRALADISAAADAVRARILDLEG